MYKIMILKHNGLEESTISKLVSIADNLNYSTVEFIKINADAANYAIMIDKNEIVALFNQPIIVLANNDNLSTIILSQIAIILNTSIVNNVINFHSATQSTIAQYNAKVYINITNNNRYKLYLISCSNFKTDNTAQAYNPTRPDNLINFSYKCKTIVQQNVLDSNLESNNLKSAQKIVSGGIALSNAVNFNNLIIELAKKINGDYAGSLIAAEQKLMPFNRHIGQTGIKVEPQWYIAIGISGAPQHIMGITSAKNIIAINKDPQAPIFQYADYGFIGDLFEIIPTLIENL
jgi:electron transfer flavoprotein alpha subunit